MDGRIGFAGDGGRADRPVAMVEEQTMSSVVVVVVIVFVPVVCIVFLLRFVYFGIHAPFFISGNQ